MRYLALTLVLVAVGCGDGGPVEPDPEPYINLGGVFALAYAEPSEPWARSCADGSTAPMEFEGGSLTLTDTAADAAVPDPAGVRLTLLSVCGVDTMRVYGLGYGDYLATSDSLLLSGWLGAVIPRDGTHDQDNVSLPAAWDGTDYALGFSR